MPGFYHALFFVLVGLILAGCPEKPSHYLLRDTVPEDQFTFIDTLKEKAIRSYSIDPELSENYLNQAIRACDSINLPQKKFQLFLEKAEFYQYRKPDFLESVRNLSAAVRIFIQHPGPYAEDPYIYINIGNFFYRLRHYDKANSFYRLADVIAEKIDHPHARAIALQNIGLAWKEMGRPDSALAYFMISKGFSLETGYLTRAQSYLYLSEWSVETADMKFVRVYVDSALKLIGKFKQQKPQSLGTVYPKLLVACRELESKLHQCKFTYYHLTKNPDSAAYHYREALKDAREAGSDVLLAGLFLEALLHHDSSDPARMDEGLADSVFRTTSRIHDPFILKKYTDTLASFFREHDNPVLHEKYAELSATAGDSIQYLLVSDELFENQILISSAAAEQVIQKMNYENKSHQRELLFFRVILAVIIVAAIILLSALIVLVRQKRSLGVAYRNLSVRIRQSLHSEQQAIPEIKDSFSDKKSEILQKLEALTEQKKMYLHHELTLTELASMLQTNKSYLSEVINTRFGLNFNDYINQLRVKEACRMMMEPESTKSSLDQIAGNCGFSSKSTFYVAFRKSTGMSPAAFSRTLRKEQPRTLGI